MPFTNPAFPLTSPPAMINLVFLTWFFFSHKHTAHKTIGIELSFALGLALARSDWRHACVSVPRATINLTLHSPHDRQHSPAKCANTWKRHHFVLSLSHWWELSQNILDSNIELGYKLGTLETLLYPMAYARSTMTSQITSTCSSLRNGTFQEES